jgi:signal transduction histidine kinase
MPLREPVLGRGLSIASKGLLLVAVPVIAQIAVLLVLRTVQAGIAEAEILAIHSKDVLLQTDEIHRLAVQALAAQRGAVITNDPDHREESDPAPHEITERAEALTNFVGDNPVQQQRGRLLVEHVRDLERWIEEQRAFVRSGRRDVAAERVRTGDGSQRLEALRADLSDFLREESRLSDERSAAMRARTDRSRTIITLAAVVSLGIACMLAFVFSREISSRFRVVTANAGRMAAGEPLAPQLGGTDEIAQLDAVLHATSRRLADAADSARRAREELERRLDQLNELNEQLRQQTEENETFIYSVSHDLRSPLVNLQGFSKELLMTCEQLKTLIDQAALPAAAATQARALVDRDIGESVQYIRKAVSRASAIIDSLLRLSRAGKVEYRLQRVHVAQIVQNVVDAMRSTINDRKADVRVRALDDAWGDATAIEQVFANLIGNAVSYLDPSRPGKVEVGMMDLPESPSEPSVRTYYVRDNGLGIPDAAIGKIFTAFQRYHSTHAVGEGLGLALVRRIVERHRGRIWAESREGHGSVFYFELPGGPPFQAPAVIGEGGDAGGSGNRHDHRG